MKGSSLPPYGVAIQDAIASGDLDRMRRVEKQAEAHLQQFGDVAQSLRNLRQEITGLEGSQRKGVADVMPYGDPMRAAMVSGDVNRMKEMIHVAENWLTRVADVQKALTELKREVARRTKQRKA